jgi:hypothetical protein
MVWTVRGGTPRSIRTDTTVCRRSFRRTPPGALGQVQIGPARSQQLTTARADGRGDNVQRGQSVVLTVHNGVHDLNLTGTWVALAASTDRATGSSPR